MAEEKKIEVWTPPEKLDQNTQRMAWLLFLEEWKKQDEYCSDKLNAETYERCLRTAKIVRAAELKEGS